MLKNNITFVLFYKNSYLMKIILSILLLFFLAEGTIYAQEFSKKEQYEQAMKNAKQAFDAEQYSEALMFYKEAIDINPNALLPKYKIEDIKTIYIKKELSIIKKEPVNKKISNKKKKDILKEEKEIKKKAEVEAFKKMNKDVDELKAELKQEDVDVVDIDEELVLEDSLIIDNIAPDRDANMQKIKIKQQVKLKERKKDSLVLVNKKYNSPKVKQKVKTKKIVVIVKNKDNIIEENNKLIKKYPNKKTVENIDKNGKHITRIIINIDNNVTIYLKVKYDWGAVYFFVDEVGKDLRSISENYFNVKTNLETYGY